MQPHPDFQLFHGNAVRRPSMGLRTAPLAKNPLPFIIFALIVSFMSNGPHIAVIAGVDCSALPIGLLLLSRL